MGMTPEQAKQLEENTRLTREIYTALTGHRDYGVPGLVGQVKDHEDRIVDQSERITKLERRFWQWTGILTGIGIAWEAFKAYLDNHSK